MTIQPNEGVSLSLGAKIPGTRMRIRPVNMEFLYGTAFLSQSPEAYERLILDAMRGEATLFTRNDEVEAQWRICDPIVSRAGRGRRAAAAVRRGHAGSGRGRRAAARRTPAGARSDLAVAEARTTTPSGRRRTRRPARSKRHCARLLLERHAENDGYVPARVLNLSCSSSGVERRDRKPATPGRPLPRLAHDRLRGERGAHDIDALATVAAATTPTDGDQVLTHETVILDLGPGHLERLETIVDPLVITDLTTLVWAPHGHWRAVEALRGSSQCVLLDSADDPTSRARCAGRTRLLADRYVVDLAWLRSSRGASAWRRSSTRLPATRPVHRRVGSVTVRHGQTSTASGLLLLRLAGLAPGLAAQPARAARQAAAGLGPRPPPGRRADAPAGPRAAGARPVRPDAADGIRARAVRFDRAPGGLRAHYRNTVRDVEREWTVLGASRGEGGILRGSSVARSRVTAPTPPRWRPPLPDDLMLSPRAHLTLSDTTLGASPFSLDRRLAFLSDCEECAR